MRSEDRAGLGGRRHCHPAAVGLGDLRADAQARTQAATGLRQILRFDGLSAIGNLEMRRSVAERRRNRHRRVFCTIGRRIADQVGQQLSQAPTVAAQRPRDVEIGLDFSIGMRMGR